MRSESRSGFDFFKEVKSGAASCPIVTALQIRSAISLNRYAEF